MGNGQSRSVRNLSGEVVIWQKLTIYLQYKFLLFLTTPLIYISPVYFALEHEPSYIFQFVIIVSITLMHTSRREEFLSNPFLIFSMLLIHQKLYIFGKTYPYLSFVKDFIQQLLFVRTLLLVGGNKNQILYRKGDFKIVQKQKSQVFILYTLTFFFFLKRTPRETWWFLHFGFVFGLYMLSSYSAVCARFLFLSPSFPLSFLPSFILPSLMHKICQESTGWLGYSHFETNTLSAYKD